MIYYDVIRTLKFHIYKIVFYYLSSSMVLILFFEIIVKKAVIYK